MATKGVRPEDQFWQWYDELLDALPSATNDELKGWLREAEEHAFDKAVAILGEQNAREYARDATGFIKDLIDPSDEERAERLSQIADALRPPRRKATTKKKKA
jgi:hypothetical protein